MESDRRPSRVFEGLSRLGDFLATFLFFFKFGLLGLVFEVELLLERTGRFDDFLADSGF